MAHAPRTVLVTGASGFIGRSLAGALAGRGDRVRALVRPASTGRPPQGVEAVPGALEPRAVAGAAEGASVVVHLAGLTRASSEAEFMRANAEGAHAAALGAREAGARLVLVSSLAAAGPGTPESPRRETDEPRPITPYGRSKLEGERRARTVPGLDLVVVRPPGVYGPGDRDFLFAFRAARRGLFPVLGDPRRAYTLVHVDDLVVALLAAIDRPAASGRTYFAGHPEPVAYERLLRGIAGAVGRSYRPIPIPDAALTAAAAAGELAGLLGRVGLVNRSRALDLRAPGWVCDPAAILAELGVRATVGLEDGLRSTAGWYRRQGWV